jgi:hypothetical protein
MPPRFAYWTILAAGLPTSFRAANREDLLPTLRRLKERHPDAEMKWFQRGKLWVSPEAARTAFQSAAVSRGRDWRPGGEHRDPRAALENKKRERNQHRRRQRFSQKQRRLGDEDPERQRSKADKRTGPDSPRARRSAGQQRSSQGRRR